MTTPERLAGAMRALTVGDTVRLTVFRDGTYRRVEYVLPERPILPGDLPDDRSGAPTESWPRPRPDRTRSR